MISAFTMPYLLRSIIVDNLFHLELSFRRLFRIRKVFLVPVLISYTIGPKVSIKILYKIYPPALCFYQKIYNINRHIHFRSERKCGMSNAGSLPIRWLTLESQQKASASDCCFSRTGRFPAGTDPGKNLEKQYKNIENTKLPIYIYSMLCYYVFGEDWELF